jgi:hypothetical protein
VVSTNFIGLEINHLNWKNHIDQIITNLSGAYCAVRLMFHIALLALESVYFTDFNGLSSVKRFCFTKESY